MKMYFLPSSLVLCRAGEATGETGLQVHQQILPSPFHLTEREVTLLFWPAPSWREKIM